MLSMSLSMSGAMAINLHLFKKSKTSKVAVADSSKSKKGAEYDKLFKEKHPIADGMIKLHNVKGKLYFEFPVKLLGRELLIGSTVSEISDNGDAIIGSKPTAPLHVKFTKQDDKIQLRNVSCDNITDNESSNTARAIALSSIGAIVKNYKIAAYSKDSSAVVFEMTDFFVGDNKEMKPFDAGGLYEGSGYTRSASYQSDRSYLGEIKAFSDNVTIKSHLSYTYSLTRFFDKRMVAKDVPFTAVMTRSIVLLDTVPSRPRIGDYRMAIFPTGKNLFADKDQSSRTIYYSNRWKLEPSDAEAYKRGEKVEPKKPIVFYIDNNFPEVWKKYIKEGVEQWNEVFEEIGFKNVISAKPFPTDDPGFDPDNMKYSCIRYAPIAIANAMGPSWTDPRSGEIITASVYVYHNIIELLNNWLFVQTSQTDKRVRNKNIPEEIIGDGLRYVIAHEVGHCLGLMHNMSGSSVVPVDSLRSPSYTQKYGTTSSIMDYARFNYVAQPGDFEKGVKLTPPRFGRYDHFSIKWLYTAFPGKTTEEETDTLERWISEKSGDPVYRFGKQQGMPLDPKSQTEDLGDDAIKASNYGIKNLKYIMSNFSSWVDSQDMDYTYRSDIYDAIISQYVRYLNHIYANIGGVYLQEIKKGDVGEAYISVPKEKQRKALHFMFDQIGNLDWIDNKEVTAKLTISGSAKTLLENSITRAIIAAPQKVRFSATLAKDPYTFNDCADEVYAYVWKSTLQGKKPSDAEMNLQKAFVKGFINDARLVPAKGQQSFSESESVTGLISDPTGHPAYLCSCGEDHQAVSHEMDPVAGYGTAFAKLSPMFYNESECYAYLVKVRSLLKRSLATSSAGVKAHYDLLLHIIDNSLKID